MNEGSSLINVPFHTFAANFRSCRKQYWNVRIEYPREVSESCKIRNSQRKHDKPSTETRAAYQYRRPHEDCMQEFSDVSSPLIVHLPFFLDNRRIQALFNFHHKHEPTTGFPALAQWISNLLSRMNLDSKSRQHNRSSHHHKVLVNCQIFLASYCTWATSSAGDPCNRGLKALQVDE